MTAKASDCWSHLTQIEIPGWPIAVWECSCHRIWPKKPGISWVRFPACTNKLNRYMIIYASVVSMHVYIIMSLQVFIYFIYSLPSQVQQLLPSRIKVCQIMSIITKVQGGVKEGALKKLHVEPQDNSNDEWSSESWYVLLILLFLSFSCSSGFTTEFFYFHVLWLEAPLHGKTNNGHIPHPNVPPDFIAQDGIGWWFMMF